MLLGRDSIAGTKLRTANISRRLLLPVLVAKYMRNHSSLRKGQTPTFYSPSVLPHLPLLLSAHCFQLIGSPAISLPQLMPLLICGSEVILPFQFTHNIEPTFKFVGSHISVTLSPISRKPNGCGNETRLATSLPKKEYPPYPPGVGTKIISSSCPFAILSCS